MAHGSLLTYKLQCKIEHTTWISNSKPSRRMEPVKEKKILETLESEDGQSEKKIYV